MTSDTENLFMCSLINWYIFSGETSVHVLYPSLIRLLFLLLLAYWSSLHVLSINPYQTCDLQILSLSHKLPFLAVDYVL